MLRVCQYSQLQQYKTSSSFLLLYLLGYRLNSLFCCLWRNVEVSCHKHSVVFSRNQHRRLLPAMCHNLRDSGRGPPATVFITSGSCSVNTGSQARLRIAISAYPTCIQHPRQGGGRVPSEYRHPVWYGKTRMVPSGEKISKISLFVLTECTNVTDRQTHAQTPHGGIGRACISSRGKNDFTE